MKKTLKHEIELIKANKVEVKDILATFRVTSETYNTSTLFGTKKELVSTESQLVELFYASPYWYEVLPDGSLGREIIYWIRLKSVDSPDYLNYSIHSRDFLEILLKRARRIKDQEKLTAALGQEKNEKS